MPFVKYILGSLLRETMQRKVSEAVAQQATQAADPDSEPRPPGHCDVGVVCSLAAEAGGLVDRLNDQVALKGKDFTAHAGRLGERSVVVVRSGGGAQAVRHATEALLAGHRPRWVVGAGFASGLRSGIAPGDFVMPDQLLGDEGRALAVDLRMGASSGSVPRVHVGPLLSTARETIRPGDKKSLAAAHDALAADRDTFAVAEVCQREKVRFLAVRVIVDAVDETTPPDLARQLKRRSLAERAGAATGTILQKSGGAKELWRDQQDVWRAADALGGFLVGVIGQLPVGPVEAETPKGDQGGTAGG